MKGRRVKDSEILGDCNRISLSCYFRCPCHHLFGKGLYSIIHFFTGEVTAVKHRL